MDEGYHLEDQAEAEIEHGIHVTASSEMESNDGSGGFGGFIGDSGLIDLNNVVGEVDGSAVDGVAEDMAWDGVEIQTQAQHEAWSVPSSGADSDQDKMDISATLIILPSNSNDE